MPSKKPEKKVSATKRGTATQVTGSAEKKAAKKAARKHSPKRKLPRKPAKSRKLSEKEVLATNSFAEVKSKAEDYARNPSKLGGLFAEAVEKAKHIKKDSFGEVWAYLLAMIRLIRVYANGDYREISSKSFGLIVLAVVYFVSPVDAIPDWVPFIGMLDDALVVSWALKAVKDEIDAFLEWEVKGV